MRIRAVLSVIEAFAPPSLQEMWDNTGLQVGDAREECTGVLVCLDATEAVIREAAERGCNLVVSHHPLIFKGLKRLTGGSTTERAVAEAVRLGVSVYSTHTALDSTVGGISYAMAEMLGLEAVRVLSPKEGTLTRVTAYVPRSSAEDAELALLDIGSGQTRSVDGSEQRLDLEGGDVETGWGLIHEPLTAVSATVASWAVGGAVKALDGLGLGKMMSVNVEPLGDKSAELGLGLVARMRGDEGSLTMREFASRVKQAFRLQRLRLSSGIQPDTEVRTVALCGGSGGEFIRAAISAGADVYVTADIRYHDFVDYNSEICLMDVGHFESEICAKDIFYRLLTKKFPNFAVYKSELEKNPVNYL
ncbi:MAG: Nif3-like dinuclear metal center hexameric protein [Muribaculaceae bacterium]|nr:Nif3-like dinuclear metal center hexameric protein [Muribaculaceae bacterium]